VGAAPCTTPTVDPPQVELTHHGAIKKTACSIVVFLFFSSGFINGASLFRDGGGGHKVVGLMMFACAGLFIINAILEIILLRKVRI
jgi:hypothetical protein